MSHQLTRMIPRTWSAVFVTVATAVALNVVLMDNSGRLDAQEPLPAENIVPFSIPAADELPPATPSSTVLTPVDAADLSEEDAEAMLRGPVHEAFAEQVNPDPLPGLVIAAKPPETVEEVPPEVRPEGRTVEWISGYWAWDDDREDFMWVSGIWREVPQGFRWLPGYWTEAEGGYQWVAGTWVSTNTAEIEYLEESPPQSLEQGPVGLAPSVEHIWIPGCWNWTQNRYVWRPGYWSGGYSSWVWVPARYQWTPRGYYFCNGYWDYPLERRGVLFAPCYFRSQVYTTRHVRFTPRIVVASNLLQFHFWVRPRHQHYYFGDYYSTPYASRGIMPWHDYHRQHHGSDPLFCHYSRGGRGRDFYSQRTLQFNLFVNNPDRRPARTWRDQDNWGQPHGQDGNHEHSRLGNQLQNLVDRRDENSSGLRFVKLETAQRQRSKSGAEQFENLVRHRREAESVNRGDRQDGHREHDHDVVNSVVPGETKPPADSLDSGGSEAAGKNETERPRAGRKDPPVANEGPQTAKRDRIRGERPEKLTLPPMVRETSQPRTEEATVVESTVAEPNTAEPNTAEPNKSNKSNKADGTNRGPENSQSLLVQPDGNDRGGKNTVEAGRLPADRPQGRERRGDDSSREDQKTKAGDSAALAVPADPVSRGETPKGLDLPGRGSRPVRRNAETGGAVQIQDDSKKQEMPKRVEAGSLPNPAAAPAAVPEKKTGSGRRQEKPQPDNVRSDVIRKSAEETIPQNQEVPSRKSPAEVRGDAKRVENRLENSTRRLNDAAAKQREETPRRTMPGASTPNIGDTNGNAGTSRPQSTVPGIRSRATIAPERTARPESAQKREVRSAPVSQPPSSSRTEGGTRPTQRIEGRKPVESAPVRRPPIERAPVQSAPVGRTPVERAPVRSEAGAAPSRRSREPAVRPSEGSANKSDVRQRGRSKP